MSEDDRLMRLHNATRKVNAALKNNEPLTEPKLEMDEAFAEFFGLEHVEHEK